MMAHWSAREMAQIGRGTLAFSGGETGALRAGAAARAGEGGGSIRDNSI